jgi:hypothetical protein
MSPEQNSGEVEGTLDEATQAHTANIATWQDISDEAREPVKVGERHGMFGATKGHDTSGYGGLVTPTLLPGASPRPYGSWFDEVADQLGTALTTGDGPGYHEAIERVVVDRGELTFFVAREHLLAVARAMRDDPAAAFRDVHGRLRGALPERDGPRTARVYPCSRSPTAAAASASRSPLPTATRTSRRSSRSTRATTGTSARPGTCSASSSTGTRP